MDREIFRKKSIDRVSSPEQLNDYVRVTSPSIWLVLISIIVLLGGLCVWGVFGRMDTTIKTGAVCRDGILTCYIKEPDVGQIEAGMTVSVDGTVYSLQEISETPVLLPEDMASYVMHIGGLSQGEWVYTAVAETGQAGPDGPDSLDGPDSPAARQLADGTYEAIITVDSVAPIYFVIR